MSFYHPLWAAPTPAEFEKGRLALARAKSAEKASKREQAFIAALGAFYDGSGQLDHKQRVLAYEAGMEELYRDFAADQEVAVFYALSLIAAGMLDDDPAYTREKRATALLNSVMAQAPYHPGVAHYLIHGFDYPSLASLALPAARQYAGIAPASAHAQHMPSHIFTRLGLWEEAIRANRAAEAAARAYASARGLPGAWDEGFHAMDYLAYAYLQAGQDRAANRILDQLNRIHRVDPPNFKVAYAATAIPARLVLERREWRKAAALTLSPNVRNLLPWQKFPWAQANIHFARAIGAARSGDIELGRAEATRLTNIEHALTVAPGDYDWRTQVSIQRQIAEAWIAFASGQSEPAVAAMRAAAALDDRTEKHPVTPGPLLPAREQLGEMLLEAGRPALALAEFRSALERTPGRLAAISGAVRAARLVGDRRQTQHYAAELVRITKSGDGTRTAVRDARSTLAHVRRK
ncbi:MAG: hypothetical protein ABIR25_05825 [Sphingomicrobium sp.]